MAENFWNLHSKGSVMSRIEALIKECKIQSESCQYTSVALLMWLQKIKVQNRILNALPIAIGAFASFGFLEQNYPGIAAFLALITGLLPAIYEKLELQAHTDEIFNQAGQFKNLDVRFRQAAEIISLQGEDAIQSEFSSLMRQLEDLRARPVIIPEKFFLKGREKIKAGHYEPDEKTQRI